MKKINQKTKIFLFLTFFLVSFLFTYTPLNAQEYNLKGADTFMQTVGVGIGYDTDTDPETFIASIIQAALSLIGMFFLILIIIGGYQWMAAGGNEETITKSKKRIINATIGLMVVLGAYAVSYFVINIILDKTL